MDEIPSAFMQKAVFAAGGALFSLLAAYWAIGRDLSFLKGAMAHVSKAAEEFQKSREKTAKLESRVDNHEERLGVLEERILL